MNTHPTTHARNIANAHRIDLYLQHIIKTKSPTCSMYKNAQVCMQQRAENMAKYMSRFRVQQAKKAKKEQKFRRRLERTRSNLAGLSVKVQPMKTTNKALLALLKRRAAITVM